MRGKKGTPPDQDQRDLIVSELSKNLLVEAAAGTGKTTSMIDRMVALLGSGSCGSVSTLAAVTFTRKAAAELRGKFRVRLERAASESEGEVRGRLEKALSEIDQCYIGTIHSFCSRLLRERPVEAGVDLAFAELEPEDDFQIRKEAWAEHIDFLRHEGDSGLIERLDSLGVDLQLLESYFIKNFADYPDVEEWPAKDDREIPDLSETVSQITDYVQEMYETAKKLPDDCGNDKLIPKYKSIPRIVNHYPDLTDPVQCVEVLPQFSGKLDVRQYIWKGTGSFTGQDAKDELEKWRSFQETHVNPALQSFYEARYPVILELFKGAREVYDKKRHTAGRLNYQDLLMKAAALLRDKPHIRDYFRHRYTHLLVDEFQDTDPVQAEVMMLLCASDPSEKKWRKCVPRPGSLFVVGDPKQSIYRFRRADIVTYNEVKEIIRGGDQGDAGLVVSLSANFRTQGKIIDWVNNVFEPKEDEDEEKDKKKKDNGPWHFPEEDSEYSPAYVSLQAGRVEATEGEMSGVYCLTVPSDYTKEETIMEYEPDRIARFIRHAVKEKMTVPRSQRELAEGKTRIADYSDFMIVAPVTEKLSVYARKLQEYGIPHQVTGGSTLNEVHELRLLHKVLTSVVRTDDPVALAAVLRSEVFGISDASLYDFKQEGGRFNYRFPVPESLCPTDYQFFEDAFSRLRRYSSWLSILPPVSAFEKIAADLGLTVLASSRQGGDVEAGSMLKALELLRAFQGRTWSASQLVEYLGQLVEKEEYYDGVSVRTASGPMVRIMNLHKVKGLEAPVVFLAQPFKKIKPTPSLHVDRGDKKIKGYMAISRKVNYQRQMIACPPGWEEFEEKEKEFLLAERLRLLYVAATRAGAALIISQRENGNHNNRWDFFGPYLKDAAELPDYGEVEPLVRPEEMLGDSTVKEACQDIMERMEHAALPTYASRAAKKLALSERSEEDTPYLYELAEGSEEPHISGEHGVEWGSAIHALLQVAMDVPGADLEARAKSVLAEQEMSPELAGTAAQVVRQVISSAIWQRALQSRQHLTEVPFEIKMEEDVLPALARGVIDLAFQEDDGWVLVDYKTDSASDTKGLAKHYAPQLEIYSRAWQECTSEKVKEASIYFVRTGETYRVL